MEQLTNGLTIYRLSPDEVEIFLTNQYGDRLQPVDPIQMKRVHIMQEQQEVWKLARFAQRQSSQREVIKVDPPFQGDWL